MKTRFWIWCGFLLSFFVVTGSGVCEVASCGVFDYSFLENGTIESGLSEIKRVLKPDGILAVVDFKKEVEGPHGPPLSVRLRPEEVEQLVGKDGFKKERITEVGVYHYLILFIATDL